MRSEDRLLDLPVPAAEQTLGVWVAARVHCVNTWQVFFAGSGRGEIGRGSAVVSLDNRLDVRGMVWVRTWRSLKLGWRKMGGFSCFIVGWCEKRWIGGCSVVGTLGVERKRNWSDQEKRRYCRGQLEEEKVAFWVSC